MGRHRVPAKRVGGCDNAYTYTGRQLDAETGLHYYRARHFHAQLGRFCSRDPMGYFSASRYNDGENGGDLPLVGDPTSLPHQSLPNASVLVSGFSANLCEYVSGNCVIRVDPSGTYSCTCSGIPLPPSRAGTFVGERRVTSAEGRCGCILGSPYANFLCWHGNINPCTHWSVWVWSWTGTVNMWTLGVFATPPISLGKYSDTCEDVENKCQFVWRFIVFPPSFTPIWWPK